MKIKLLLIIVSVIWFVSVASETVYKTRDAEGNIIFSDVPSEGAEEIIIDEAQTINIPKPKRLDNRRATKLSPEELNYTRFEVTLPEHDSTIRSNEGIVNISLEMTPELDDKHMIVFFMDGKEVSSGKSLQLSLQGIDRGSHTIAALIENENKKILKRSKQTTFHLRKESKLFKNRAKDNVNNGNTVITPPAGSDTPPEIPKIPTL
ncbi:MAG: DUF4124 domain-containing protein [Proteobacteria bacterium]|nr:DUF4124 domain-containing protein [Pseudomonadota bacterium]NOG61006.1 DUF4124 domain-containing protein [Pseudomonadota bacterium]